MRQLQQLGLLFVAQGFFFRFCDSRAITAAQASGNPRLIRWMSLLSSADSLTALGWFRSKVLSPGTRRAPRVPVAGPLSVIPGRSFRSLPLGNPRWKRYSTSCLKSGQFHGSGSDDRGDDGQYYCIQADSSAFDRETELGRLSQRASGPSRFRPASLFLTPWRFLLERSRLIALLRSAP